MFAALSALRESLGSFGSWKGVEVKSSGIFCASFLIIALVYGCGGGDGGGSAMTPPPAPPAVMPKAALEPSVQAAQAPLFDFGDNLHIGTGLRLQPENSKRLARAMGWKSRRGRCGTAPAPQTSSRICDRQRLIPRSQDSRRSLVRRSSASSRERTRNSPTMRCAPFRSSTPPCLTISASGLVILLLLIRWVSMTCRVAASISNSFRRPNGRGESIWARVQSAMRNHK